MHPFFQAEAHVLDGLGPGFGDVHGRHQPPVFTGDGFAVAGGLLLANLPGLGQGHVPGAGGGPQGEHPQAVLTRHAGAGGGDHGRHRHFQMGAGVGGELHPGFREGEPAGFPGHGLAAQQGHDGRQRLLHHFALAEGVDAHHEGVGGQRARPDAQHEPSPGLPVQLGGPAGHHQRVVIGQGDHPGAQPDVTGAFRRRGDKYFRRGDGLIPRRMVLADPGLVVAKAVQGFHQLKVPLHGLQRIFVNRVEGGQENAEAEVGMCHGLALWGAGCGDGCPWFHSASGHAFDRWIVGRLRGLPMRD